MHVFCHYFYDNRPTSPPMSDTWPVLRRKTLILVHPESLTQPEGHLGAFQ
jgi:hypothetical protein